MSFEHITLSFAAFTTPSIIYSIEDSGKVPCSCPILFSTEIKFTFELILLSGPLLKGGFINNCQIYHYFRGEGGWSLRLELYGVLKSKSDIGCLGRNDGRRFRKTTRYETSENLPKNREDAVE